MTKKDFQLIAGTIAGMNVQDRARAGLCDETARYYVAEAFADALTSTNPLFKRELFIQAATGVVSPTVRKPRQTTAVIDGVTVTMDSPTDRGDYSEPSNFTSHHRSGRRAGEA